MNNLKKEKLINSFSIEENILENKNWNEEWEKNINIIEVSDKLVIKPSFKEYIPKKNQIIITIDPKMSFGTGEHQTTKLMMMLTEKYTRKNDIVLDVGCGTAVLGITSAKLGCKRVIAIDNDEWCLLNGRENAEKNGVNNVEVRHSEIQNIPESNFDLILANINRNILIDIKQDLYNKLINNGTLIISGLLLSDNEIITDHFTKLGLTPIERKQLDEWIAIVFKKN